MILKSWDDVKTEQLVYFGVCCSASNVSDLLNIFFFFPRENVPRRCTA